MVSLGPAWHINFNVVIFSDTVNVICVNLCTVVVLIELYLFILLSVTLTIIISKSQQCQTVFIENVSFLFH